MICTHIEAIREGHDKCNVCGKPFIRSEKIMFDFNFDLSIYQNRLGELSLMSGYHIRKPVIWDFGCEYNDTEWTWVCEL